MEEVKDGIEDADSFISVISPDAVRSEIVDAEIDHAIKNSKRFIPIMDRDLVEDHDKAALHPRISSHNWIFIRDEDDFDAAFKKLVDALDTDLDYTRFHTRLLTRALEWDEKGRDTSFVLRGKDLSEAEKWYQEATESDVEKEPEITELQTAYIKVSRIAETWQRRERWLMTIITFAFFAALIAAGVAIV